ncbi:MAG TPA: MauE/DoxX family redox-associated membrane protein [Actinomycetota bacterium]|nr:MauE/DoxX family redox-associated membrane protein [Actinomycetota bacterium]
MTSDAVAPLFFLAAGLLVLAGAVKLARPHATAQALLDAGLPGSRAAARGVGVVEIVAGVWAFVVPGVGGALVLGAVYLGFAAFLGYVLRAHPDAGSCGCAGATAVPPSRLHLALDVVAGLVGLWYAMIVGPAFGAWVASLGWATVPIVAGVALAGWLAVIVVTETPAAFRAWQAPAHDHEHEPHGHDHAVADRELAASGIVTGHPSLWPGTKPEVA